MKNVCKVFQFNLASGIHVHLQTNVIKLCIFVRAYVCACFQARDHSLWGA